MPSTRSRSETRNRLPVRHEYRKTALASHLGEKSAIEDRETQPEARLQLIRPLPKHRGRCRYDDEIDPPTQQQLAQNQAGFNRFAETDIIGDQQIDAGQQQRFAQRFELISVEPDTGAEGA